MRLPGRTVVVDASADESSPSICAFAAAAASVSVCPICYFREASLLTPSGAGIYFTSIPLTVSRKVRLYLHALACLAY